MGQKKHAENGQGGKANLDEKQCRCTKGCNLMGSNQKVHLKGGGQLVIHGALPCCVLAGQVLRNSTGQMSGKAKTLHAAAAQSVVKGALIQKGGGQGTQSIGRASWSQASRKGGRRAKRADCPNNHKEATGQDQAVLPTKAARQEEGCLRL